MEVTNDLDQKFDLSLQLDDLDAAVEIARQVPELEAETKWKAIGDRALATWRFDLARESFERAGDLSALMLLLLAIGDKDGLEKLARVAGNLIVVPDKLKCLISLFKNTRVKITWLSRHYCNSVTPRPALTC